jgi:hypothetical protein
MSESIGKRASVRREGEKLLVRDQYRELHLSPECEEEVRKLRELGFSSWELAGIILEMYGL